MTLQPRRHLTLEQYFEREEKREDRSEYFRGELFLLKACFPGRKDTVTDANLIVEVLSRSTRDDDAGDKFKFYRSLPSFQEYLMISQDEYRVEHHWRQAASRWLLTEFTEPDATIPLATLPGVHLTMNSIYEGVLSTSEQLPR